MILEKSQDSIEKTAEVLKSGGIAILPTDTVYGFSGITDILNSDKTPTPKTDFKTDVKIRAIKGRSETKPLIQLIAKPEDIRLYTDDDIPPELLSKWPGALTIIVSTKEKSPLVQNVPTVAFRCPGDLWLRKIIEMCGAPIYSTSVNRSGQPILDEESKIIEEFGQEVDLIIKDGDKKDALPSTLVSIENSTVKVLRQGSVSV